MKGYDVIIVGGGASGMMTGICAARKGLKVLIIDKQKKLGHKIYATGNGKCNFTNMDIGAQFYLYNGAASDNHYKKDYYIDFVNNFLSVFSNMDTINFFEELGVLRYVRDGYVYPSGEQASSVVLALTRELERLNVDVNINEKVCNIKRIKDKDYLFEILSEYEDDSGKQKKNYKAKNVVIASGGFAGTEFGCSGDGYIYAKELGHTIIKPYPSLTYMPIIEDKKALKNLKGVRFRGIIKSDELEEKGEMIFNEIGISGIPVFQLSGRVNRYGLDTIYIDFLPQYEFDFLISHFEKQKSRMSENMINELFVGILNDRLANYLINKLGFTNKKLKDLNEKDLKFTVSKIKKFKFGVDTNNTFAKAQVTTGGVPVDEVDMNTLESKITKGLYFAGEVLDIDGICGGYNLQWAWSSGYMVGKSIKNKYL
ncbi:MAG: NAD(P)/FAD-dependent oxidoreductase [Lachnospiraceae bacterium]|nr:NAD(P)/FAD-dependent oxidoreductase [Lachnospiraceae bacterium]